jgi:hypothetical protein
MNKLKLKLNLEIDRMRYIYILSIILFFIILQISRTVIWRFYTTCSRNECDTYQGNYRFSSIPFLRYVPPVHICHYISVKEK